MDEKVKGIVIKLIDYKDADKLASIFTYDEGIITAKFTGVKRVNAKLKSVAQPFTFAEFSFAKKGENRTVTGADVLDNFPTIMENYNKTICAYVVADMIRSIIPAEKPEQDIFLLTLNSLKNIEDNDELVSTIDYILKFISFSGMDLEFVDSNFVYLDNLTGNFSAEHIPGSTQIDKKVYQTLKSVNDTEDCEKNPTILKQCLRLLHNIIYLKFNEDIKSFQFI